MKKSIVVLFLVALALTVLAQEKSTADRATEGLALLKSLMRDPDSFVAERVFVSDTGNFCYAFRSHNGYGGYTDGIGFYNLVQKGKNSGKWVAGVEDEPVSYYSSCNFYNKKKAAHLTEITADVLKQPVGKQ